MAKGYRNKNRQFDKTYLSIDAAEERHLQHRDLICHSLRHSHTIKHLLKNHLYKESIILDVGCGKEMPQAKMLYVNKLTPALYVGVDMNRMEIPDMLKGKKIPIRLFTETDICSLGVADVGLEVLDAEGRPNGHRRPDLITCFEVFEHVVPSYGRKMLEHARDLMEPSRGTILISTPCWNGSAAENHISEHLYLAFGAVLEDVGFSIDAHYGTFASIRDYEDTLRKDSETDDPSVVTIHEAFARLREYYDSNMLAIIFAPLYPQYSRNCLWRLSHSQPAGYERKFPLLKDAPTPWSQHPDWRDLAGGGQALEESLTGVGEQA